AEFSIIWPSHQKNVYSTLTPIFRAEQYPKDYYESVLQILTVLSRACLFKQPLLVHAHQQIQFIQDFVAVYAKYDIPLEKIRNLRPFLVKHCKQGGALPENESSLRQTHLPRVLKHNSSFSLSFIAGVENQYFLVDVIFMDR
uniref:Uncharacterized protein n=1 Tax=Salmo trutta TaxID=8032 RepID=A0A673XHB5_SALTR